MNYTETLIETAERNRSIVCLGLDPDLERIPLRSGEIENDIATFFTNIIEGILAEDVSIGAVKPNVSFYRHLNRPGQRALERIIKFARSKKLPVIFDAKYGDIGNTSEQLARESFQLFDSDAVTVNPYMGSDSVGPFIEYHTQGKGVYILVRTSNPGASEIQDLIVDGVPLYEKMAERVIEWHKPGVGAVVGATAPEELRRIVTKFVESGKNIPLLIPGVGSQGGSASEVVAALRESGGNLAMHRINSSRGILYAYEHLGTDDYVGAAVKAVKELNQEIGF